ncbi:hypothetical protein JB92DRAFT_2817902 [Gautieria morchelliformis]|nr:hypothetical protein JB92DRAFT_2817902 [Gautieria morchelliformis]
MTSPSDPEITLLPRASTLPSKKFRRYYAFLAPLRSPLRRNYYILLFLHSLLIVIHLVLLAIIFAPPGHLEHRVSVALGRQSNALQSAIVVISMAFNVTFLAAILFLIQQLAHRRALHTRQTLTAVHDTFSAWGGIGSALSVMYAQRKRATALWRLFCVTAYLVGMSGLHITTPGLFSVATFNNTFPGTVDAKSRNPVFSWPPSIYQNLDDASYVLPMLNLLQHTNTTIGLNGNVIFDVVGPAQDDVTGDFRPLSEDIGVNATAFHVTCGLLPQARQNGTSNGTVWSISTPLRNSGQYFDAAPIRLLTRYGIRFLPDTGYATDQSIAAQTALLYASVNVTDDQGSPATTLQLDPLMPGVPDRNQPDFPPAIIACNLNLTNMQVYVDSSSKNITAGSMPIRTVQSTWQDWKAPDLSTDPLIASWGSIFNIGTLSSTPANLCASPRLTFGLNHTCQTFDYLTITEKFLNDRLQLRPDSQVAYVDGSTIKLKDLEMALENMTAAVYWSAANNPPSLPGDPDYRASSLNTMNIRVSNPNAQLNLNIVPVACGLCVSIALLVLALAIVRLPGQSTSTLDSELNVFGLLQFMWLLGTGSDAQSQVAEVERPTTDNLRQAGMIDIRLGSLVHRGRWEEEDE